VENLLLEPIGRGTAAGIAYAAAKELSEKNFDVLVTIPADHIIPDVDEWCLAVEAATTFAAEQDHIVCVGVIPEVLTSKFGYILSGERVGGTAESPLFRVAQFVEKPAPDRLEAMAERADLLRNVGMIAFKPSVMMSEIRQILPDVGEAFDIACASGFEETVVDSVYAQIQSTSIDSALLQVTDRLAVIRGGFQPVDAGDFASLGEVLVQDENGNAVFGKTVTVDAHSNTVVSDGATVALVGIEDHIVVVEGATVLVCPKDQSQRIREVAGR
jgi:mannose-1-phosphate guanylyltransferase